MEQRRYIVYIYNGDIDYVLDNEIKEESGTIIY
jgi:hypothetical protein